LPGNVQQRVLKRIDDQNVTEEHSSLSLLMKH
jgi:hypothetical protein